MPQREVFLSHASLARKFATELAEVLRRHGISVWYSKTHIRGAQQWHDAIGRALARCTWFVVILSPDAVDSMWVKNELLFALNQRRYRDRIAPVLYKKCKYEKLSWTLSSFQIVDFTESIEAGYRELLRVWEVDLVTPKPKKSRAARTKKPSRKSG